jgi:hypothetical protein
MVLTLAGAGKSIIAYCSGSSYITGSSIVIDFLNKRFPATTEAVVYTYFDYKEQNIQTEKQLVANLLRQLVCRLDTLPTNLEQAYEKSMRQRTDPDVETLL